jgi:hypothetical protein
MKYVVSLILLFAATAANAQSLGNFRIFPPNNPWNQRVDSLPVHWNSDKYIAHVGATVHVHPDFGSDPAYGIPWTVVGSQQPFVPLTVTGYIDESDLGSMPIPADAKVEQPAPPGGDGHVLVVDTSNHHLYELYQGIKDGSGPGWSATCSAVFALDSNNFRPDGWTSCDAAGLPIFPGLVRKYECDQGEIKHALRFTVSRTQKGWIFPARHHAGATTDTTVMPMGLRLRLKRAFDDSKFTGYAKVISTALKRYGIILADNGSNWFITGENNTAWPDEDISQLKAIVGGDFEAVYTGPVRTSPNQYPDPTFDPLRVENSEHTVAHFAYPNPTSSYLNVESGGATHIALISAMGQIITSAEAHEQVVRLDLAHVPAGVYLLRRDGMAGAQMITVMH